MIVVPSIINDLSFNISQNESKKIIKNKNYRVMKVGMTKQLLVKKKISEYFLEMINMRKI